MITHTVDSYETKEILAIELAADESEDSWRPFFKKPKKGGLKRTCLCILDAHAHIQAATMKELLEASLWHKIHLIVYWPTCPVGKWSVSVRLTICILVERSKNWECECGSI